MIVQTILCSLHVSFFGYFFFVAAGSRGSFLNFYQMEYVRNLLPREKGIGQSRDNKGQHTAHIYGTSFGPLRLHLKRFVGCAAACRKW